MTKTAGKSRKPASKPAGKTAARGEGKVRAVVPQGSGNGGPPVLVRFRKEAESLQRKLRSSADRTLRQIEKQVLHQLHAATEDQVRRLERRLGALEKTVQEYDRRVRALGVI